MTVVLGCECPPGLKGEKSSALTVAEYIRFEPSRGLYINSVSKKLEATSGFEPLNRGFADPRLATWLRRHISLKVRTETNDILR